MTPPELLGREVMTPPELLGMEVMTPPELLGREVMTPPGLLGMEVMSPPELLVPGVESLETFPEEHVHKLRENLEKCFATAKKTLQAELKRTKIDFDINFKKHLFRRVCVVYYLEKSAQKGKYCKLKPIWKGPAIIITALTPYTHRVKLKKKDFKIVNHGNLKVCSDRELPS